MGWWTGLSNWTSSRLPDVWDIIWSRTFGRPVRRSVRGVKLHLLGGSGERFRPLDFYADDVDGGSPQDQRWRRPIRRSCPRNPTTFRLSARSCGRRGRFRSTRLRARPIIWPRRPTAVPGGRARGSFDRAARARTAAWAYIRPSALFLSHFFSPLSNLLWSGLEVPLAGKIHPLASHLWEKKSDTLKGEVLQFFQVFLKTWRNSNHSFTISFTS